MKTLNDKYENAVKTADGKLENFTLIVAKQRFACRCRCNVFHKPEKTVPTLYKCNACGAQYEAVK